MGFLLIRSMKIIGLITDSTLPKLLCVLIRRESLFIANKNLLKRKENQHYTTTLHRAHSTRPTLEVKNLADDNIGH